MVPVPSYPRTDTNVTGPVCVTAVFAINQYALIYSAGTNGSIWGPSSQTVNYDGNGEYVAALPHEGYHFSGWSDAWVNPGGGLLNAIRRDMNVTANINVTASFAPNTYTLSYAPGENGSLLGQTPQSVYYGQDGAAVQAVPDTGYYFVSWSDGNTDNPRVDTNVQGSLTVTANFAYIFSPEFNLTSYLPVWMEFLRDTSSENPKDTLAWFRDDPYAMYDYVLTLDWGSNYNLWIAWIYGVWIERNSSLVIDCATLLNLNVEDQGRSIADIVELYCMELILKDTDHTLHASTKAAYLSNLAKWHEYYELLSNMFPQFSAPPLGIQFLQAAYSTLDPVAGILAANFYGVHLSRLYNIALPKPPGDFITLSEFVQHDDLDTDGYTNLEEFYYVNHMLDFPLLNACNGVKDSGVANALDIYANYLLNGQIKPGINKPPVTYDYPWQSCICSSSYAITKKIQSEYYNNYFSGDEGMILLEPQKERYQLGERVQITYVPSVDTRLVRWDVDPASHTAKWSREQSTHIYITNNTTVTAVIRQQKNLMLNVHILNPEYGDVSSFSAFYDYGSTVSPHISPDPGYVCNWLFAPVSYKSRLYNDENPSIYMEGSVSLSVVYEGEDDRFSYGPISTISIDGGTGKILASNGYCCCTHDDNDIFHQCGCATGPYLRNSVTRGQGYFSARCIPDPDFSFGYWKFSDGSGNYYCTHNEVDSLPSVAESALTAHLVPTISLEVQVEGQGVVTSGGFRSYYPSRIYYTSTYLDTFKGERIDANRVQMQHNACPGWSFDHWEIQDAQGAWTTVLNPQGQTEIGDLTVYMNWSGPSSQIHPCEGQERFRVKAVFIIEPGLLVIVSGTQFTYYNNTCSISAKVFPDNGNYTWRLTPIEGANLTIFPNTQNQSDVVFKYTNLPADNDEFGYKELAVTNLCNGHTASKMIEVFFDKSGTDHPTIPENEAPNFYSHIPWTHSLVLPNWFYYWRQTNAGNVQPTPLYHHTVSRAAWDTSKQQWCVWIGQQASSNYGISIASDQNLTLLNINKDAIVWASNGIDTFAWNCRHEASHVSWYEQWYPAGDSQISAFSADGDTIDDMWELTSGYNTSIPDSNNDLQPDCEDLTIRTQGVWIHYAAQMEDWANPGQQYDPTN